MIALYQGTSPVSRLIQWRTWSPFSHAAWVYGDGAVIEAWKGVGVHEADNLGSAHRPGTRVELLSIQLTDSEEWDLMAFLRAQIGKRYDYRGVLGFISHRDSAQQQNAWFCSELIAAAFESIGRPLLARIPPWRVTPGMLWTSPLLKQEGRVTTGRQCLREFPRLVEVLP